MVLNLGAFYQGVQENDARERAKRKENAALYNEFIRLNPDASVKQREAYANELGGNSPFLRAAMPTTEVMAANVARRKQQVAAASQAKKYKALQQKISLMNDATTMFSNVYSSTGDLEQANKAVTDMFSGYLDGNDMLGISAAGTKKAQQDFDKDFATTYDLWQKQGSQASAVETWDKTYNPTFLKKWKSTALSEMNRLTQEQLIKANTEASNIGASSAADPSLKENFVKNFKTKYPRLSEEQMGEVMLTLDNREAQATKKINNDIAVAKQGVQNHIAATLEDDPNYSNNMEVNALQTDAAIRDQLKKMFDADPVLVGKEPTADDVQAVKDMVEKSLKAQIQIDDAKEAANLKERAEQQEVGRYTPRFEDNDGNLDVKQQNDVEDKMLAQLFPEVDTDDKEDEVAKELAKNQFLNNFRMAAENWDISIKDPAVYGSIMQKMVDLIMADNSGADGTFQDHFFIKAVNDYYSNTSLNTPEAVAFRNALAAERINSLEEAQLLAEEGNTEIQLQWVNTFKKIREDYRNIAFENFDKKIFKLQILDEKAADFIDDIDDRVETLTQRDGVKLIANVEELINAPVSEDGLKNLELKNTEVTASLQKVVNIGREVEDQIAQINAYLKLPRFRNDPSLADTRAALENKLKQLEAGKRMVLGEAQELKNSIMKIRSASKTIKETKVIDNNAINQENTPDVVKDKATVLAHIVKKNRDTSGLAEVHNKSYKEKVDFIKNIIETVGGENTAGIIKRIFGDTTTEDMLIQEVANALNIDLTPPKSSIEVELENLNNQDETIKLPPSFDR
tara:strand:+ start:2213 stop:4603 length:2391 start_codon:yes stop_codon:yes gene_type:complete